MVRLRLQFLSQQMDSVRYQCKCSHGMLATITLNPIQTISCDKLIAVVPYAGADPGGGPGGPGPRLTLGFEAPKLSIFGPYLIFP